MDDLVTATCVKPGSLYHAFPGGNRGLFLEALARYANQVFAENPGELERAGARLAKRRGEIHTHVDPRAKAAQLNGVRMGLMVVGKTDPGAP